MKNFTEKIYIGCKILQKRALYSAGNFAIFAEIFGKIREKTPKNLRKFSENYEKFSKKFDKSHKVFKKINCNA